MIAPRTAKRKIARHCRVLGTQSVAIADALGHTLAEDVCAPFSLPAFHNSAMDGFALCSGDTRGASTSRPVRIEIDGTIWAGDPVRRLMRGRALRIMTGAPIPSGADTVIPKEDAAVDRGSLIIDRPMEPLRHVRRRGEEVKAGTRVLKKGILIHPGVIGCLAALGLERVRVVRKPVVSIITTGDELVPPGEKRGKGGVYDSNSPMISAALRDMRVPLAECRRVRDRRDHLTRAVRAALKRCDVLIAVGGVSVGERDHLRPVLRRAGVRTVFWRVEQKPGKPIYFGVKGKRLVFGLPGNPASAYTCFYLYVYPALRRLSGFREADLPRRSLALTNAVAGDRRRWQMLKGKLRAVPRPGVMRLPKQGSHMVTSLARADRFIAIPPSASRIAKGRHVVTYRLPHADEEGR